MTLKYNILQRLRTQDTQDIGPPNPDGLFWGLENDEWLKKTDSKKILRQESLELDIIEYCKSKINSFLEEQEMDSDIPQSLVNQIRIFLHNTNEPSKMIIDPHKLISSRTISKFNTSFQKIKSFIKKADKLIELLDIEKRPRICQYVHGIRVAYSTYIEEVCHAPRLEGGTFPSRQSLEEILREQISVFLFDVPPCLLTYRARRFLIDHASKKMEGPRSSIQKFENIFYKFPIFPGTDMINEFENNLMIQTLTQIITKREPLRSDLIRLKGPENLDTLCLVSKRVSGFQLDTILANDSGIISQIDPTSFSSQIIVSLLTNPTQANQFNYIVDDNFQLVLIENEESFVPSITRHGTREPFWVLNLRNILYFFPQMKKKIDSEFAQYFLTQSPEMVMISWLSALHQRVSYFENFQDHPLFAPTELCSPRKPTFNMIPRLVTSIYNKLKQIHELIMNNPSFTHEQLFHSLDPLSASCYSSIDKQYYGDLILCFEMLTKTRPKRVDKFLSPKEFEQWKLEAESIDFGSRHQEKTQSLKEATTQFLGEIDFSSLSFSDQQSILQEVKNLSFLETLIIRNETSLDWHFLKFGLIGQLNLLREIRIIGSHSLKSQDLIIATKEKEEFTISVSVDCVQIGVEGWKELLKEKQTRKGLEVLILVENLQFSLSEDFSSLLSLALSECPDQKELIQFLTEMSKV